MQPICKFVLVWALIRLATSTPPVPCPAPISQWTEATISPTPALADSFFCFLYGTTDKIQCSNLRAFVSDIRDAYDNQYIVGYLNAIYNNSHGAINPFPATVGLVKNETQHYWSDNCLNPLQTVSSLQIIQSVQQNDFYLLKSDGSLVAGSTTTSAGVLCRYDAKPCSRPEYSQKCTTAAACQANDSCFTCSGSATATTMLSVPATAIATSTTKAPTSATTVASTLITTTQRTTTTASTQPPIKCPYPLNVWIRSVSSPTTTLTDSWFCYLPGVTDSTQCTALKAYASDIRDSFDSQYIIEYLNGIYNNSNGTLTPFPAMIGLVKSSSGNIWNDGCLNPSLSPASAATVSIQTNDTYVLNANGSITPGSSSHPAGILCRYDTKPCNRPEYYQRCSSGLTCIANDSCYFCGVSTIITKITTTTATTTKQMKTIAIGIQQATLPLYDNPFELTTTAPELSDDVYEQTSSKVYRGIFWIMTLLVVANVAIVITAFILRVLSLVQNDYNDYRNP